MSYQYTNERRAKDAHSLPDVEVFYMGAEEIADAEWVDGDGDPMEPGWYFAFGLPGYLWDGEPSGPYSTADDALAAAREAAGVCPHGCEDDESCEACDATLERSKLNG